MCKYHLLNQIILSSLLLTSCNTNQPQNSLENVFKETFYCNVIDSINLDEIDVIQAYGVKPFGDKFVFMNTQQSHNVTLLNQRENNIIQGVLKGQGPEETVRFMPVQSGSTKSFLYADQARNIVFSFPLESDEILAHRELQFPDTLHRFSRLSVDDRGDYYGMGVFVEGRICVYNAKNKTVRYVGEYPTIPNLTYPSPRHEAVVFANSFMCVHPQNQRVFVANCGMFDLYACQESVSDVHIKSLTLEYPLMQMFGTTGPAFAYKKEGVEGAIGLTCNSNYIYVLYSNQTKEKSMTSGRSGNIILQFDWNGNPIHRYDCDQDLVSIALDRTIMYGLKTDGSMLYKYEIEQ